MSYFDHNKNSGFSLVEVIVVVLIIGILSTGAAMSISTVVNADSERATRNLITILTTARSKAMAYNDDASATKIKIVARIWQNDNGDYYAGIYELKNGSPGSTLDEKKLSSYRVQIDAAKKDGTRMTIDKDNPLKLSFKKETGGLSSESIALGYVDLYLTGNESHHIVLSIASGRCFLSD